MRNRETLGDKIVQVFTDGSCHPASGEGGWAAIILEEGENFFLSGKASGTTHQRMELIAAVEAMLYIRRSGITDQKIFLYTDSQYLADLSRRKISLSLTGLKTKKKVALPNTDLVVQIFQFLENFSLQLIKVPSHQKDNGRADYNREADKCSRKIVRESVRNLKSKV